MYKKLTIFQRSLLLVIRVDTRLGGERVAGPVAAPIHNLLAFLVMQRRRATPAATNVSPCHRNEHVQVVDDVARLVQ